MKRFYTVALLLFVSSTIMALPKYWVGASNGNWSDPTNWSNEPAGAGGAAVPNAQDSVIFDFNSRASRIVHVDISPVIKALNIQDNVTLYASTPVVFTLLNSLEVAFSPFDTGGIFKDSTSADVPFSFVFNGATKAQAIIKGTWIFEGGVPVNRLAGNGASFTAEPGSKVVIENFGLPFNSRLNGSTIIFKKYTNFISSDPSTLIFSSLSRYVLENNLDAAIPDATWNPGNGGRTFATWAAIFINGSMGKLKHLSATPVYRQLVVDLPGQTTDASLELSDGASIGYSLEIKNTNDKTLTLLSATGNSSAVGVKIEGIIVSSCCVDRFGGILSVTGNSKIAMATAPAAAPATDYHLSVQAFTQAGGNFSLQDYSNTMGSSTLSIRTDLTQTGGTFITNSATTNPAAKFTVEMSGPQFASALFGPGAPIVQKIEMSGGSIDNGNHKVRLKIAQSFQFPPDASDLTGVELRSPLQVGGLDLVVGTLTTTSANILTVMDPDPVSGIKVGTSGLSYINGPLRRWTNSTNAYVFPTGSGSHFRTPYLDSCVVIPASATASLYQAEYVKAAYSDLNVTAPLKGVSNAEYWNIKKVSGADASVKLLVNAAIPGATATDALVVARYSDGHWNAENGSVLTPGNTATGSVTSKSLSSFGAFTFGYGSFSEAPASGLNYKYYEGFFPMLPDFSSLTPGKTGNSANFDLGIRRSGVNDSFAIVWEGSINIPAPGNYTFETVSDDGSKLYFNGQQLVNNDGTHPPQSMTGMVNIPAAGKYPITISYFENYGGEGLQVYWTGPGIERQLIPDGAFGASMLPTGGLNYKYYEGFFPMLPDFSTLTPLKTGNSANIDLGIRRSGINDSFAIVWEGSINIPTAGNYTFETVSDDGSKLYFNGQQLVNNDGTHPPQSMTGTVNIAAPGKYPITVSYFENYGGEGLQVYWTGPGIERQLIPDVAFGATVTPPASSGLNYKYYEGDFNALPDFSALAPVKTGHSPNVDISVRPAGVNDHFAFVWEGTITIPTTGSYTFETLSDDGSKLYLNSQELVNSDGLHAPWPATGTVTIAAGVYPISITYFEKDGGETMQVYWTGPGIERQMIPDAAFGAAITPPANGLNYKYYEGDYNALPDFSTLTPVMTGKTPTIDISIRPAGRNDHFAFTWEGYISIPTAGTYTFETISDDGSKLYFNSLITSNPLVNNDGLHAAYPATGTVSIAAAGLYPISISYFEKDGGEMMQVYWSGPGIERQLIPASVFSSDAASFSFTQTSGAAAAQSQSALESQTTKIRSVYPNPFRESFTIDFFNASSNNKVSVGVYDLSGRLVYNYNAGSLAAGNNMLKVNLAGVRMTGGVYIAKLTINGVPSKTVKLVKAKR